MHDTEQTFESTPRGAPALSSEPRQHVPPATPAYTRSRAPRRLYRSPDGQISGVATGIGDYIGIDPVIVRIAFLLAALSGFGLAAYLVCWVVMPMGPRPPRQLADHGSTQTSH